MAKIYTDSRDLALLIPEFREKVEQLLKNCAAAGFIMKPFFTLRGPGTQANLYAQGRSRAALQTTIQSLYRQNAPFIAKLLENAKPPNPKGGIVTYALPGQSWHQYGEAVDCYHEVNGKARWAGPAYRFYADEANRLGLTSGLSWKKFPEAVHVQFRKGNPPGILSTISTNLERSFTS